LKVCHKKITKGSAKTTRLGGEIIHDKGNNLEFSTWEHGKQRVFGGSGGSPENNHGALGTGQVLPRVLADKPVHKLGR
jgi:hypothetical protein